MSSNKSPTAFPEPGRVYILRVRTESGPLWLLADAENTVKGKPGDSLQGLQIEWARRHGWPKGWTRFNGLHRTSEAVMTLAEIQRAAFGPYLAEVPGASPAEKGGAS